MYYRKMRSAHWEAKEANGPVHPVFYSMAEVFLTLIVAFLFWLCTKKIWMEMFPEQKISVHFLITSYMAAVPAVFFCTLSRRLLPSHYGKVFVSVVLIYSAFIAWGFWWKHDKIAAQSMNLVENYLRKVNIYYKLNLTAGGEAGVFDNQTAIQFWGIVLFVFFVILGELSARKFFMGVLPCLCLLLFMAVGKTPGYPALACGFAGVVLLSFFEWNRLERAECRVLDRKWSNHPVYTAVVSLVMLVFLAAGIPAASMRLFHSKADELVQYAPKARALQAELENKLEGSFRLFIGNTQETVNNRTPRYREQEIMKVTVQGKAPTGNQYFRGFYGTDYVNGTWTTDQMNFSRECEKKGYQEKKVSAFLAFPAHTYYEKRIQGTERESDSLIAQRKMTVSYTRIRGGHVYLPYMLAGIKGADDSAFVQDTYLDKKILDKKFQFSTWDFSGLTHTDFVDEKILYEQHDGKEEEWMKWYDRYVRKYYMDSASDEVEAIALIAHDLKEFFEFSMEMDMEAALKMNVSAGRNEIVWNIAYLVSSYLRQNSYSLELDGIRDGTDPVEYFLQVSHEGYCVHFASAGVLLLRRLGIPARYVTGYVVHRDRWRKNEDGNYTASILDSDAHAWAEVYLDDLGWIPVEMTPDTGEVFSDSFVFSVAEETRNNVDTPGEKRTVRETEEPEEKEVEEPKPAEIENPSAGNKNSSDRSGKGISKGNISFKIISIFCGFACMILSVCLGIWMKRKRNGTDIQDDMGRMRNRSAVLKINRLVYRRLRRKRHILRHYVTDAEYAKMLKSAYPQVDENVWDRFMELAKKASFSRNEITSEEAAFCRSVYQKI